MKKNSVMLALQKYEMWNSCSLPNIENRERHMENPVLFKAWKIYMPFFFFFVLLKMLLLQLQAGFTMDNE